MSQNSTADLIGLKGTKKRQLTSHQLRAKESKDGKSRSQKQSLRSPILVGSKQKPALTSHQLAGRLVSAAALARTSSRPKGGPNPRLAGSAAMEHTPSRPTDQYVHISTPAPWSAVLKQPHKTPVKKGRSSTTKSGASSKRAAPKLTSHQKQSMATNNLKSGTKAACSWWTNDPSHHPDHEATATAMATVIAVSHAGTAVASDTSNIMSTVSSSVGEAFSRLADLNEEIKMIEEEVRPLPMQSEPTATSHCDTLATAVVSPTISETEIISLIPEITPQPNMDPEAPPFSPSPPLVPFPNDKAAQKQARIEIAENKAAETQIATNATFDTRDNQPTPLSSPAATFILQPCSPITFVPLHSPTHSRRKITSKDVNSFLPALAESTPIRPPKECSLSSADPVVANDEAPDQIALIVADDPNNIYDQALLDDEALCDLSLDSVGQTTDELLDSLSRTLDEVLDVDEELDESTQTRPVCNSTSISIATEGATDTAAEPIPKIDLSSKQLQRDIIANNAQALLLVEEREKHAKTIVALHKMEQDLEVTKFDGAKYDRAVEEVRVCHVRMAEIRAELESVKKFTTAEIQLAALEKADSEHIRVQNNLAFDKCELEKRYLESDLVDIKTKHEELEMFNNMLTAEHDEFAKLKEELESTITNNFLEKLGKTIAFAEQEKVALEAENRAQVVTYEIAVAAADALFNDANVAHEQDQIAAIEATKVDKCAWQAQMDALNAAREQDTIAAIEASEKQTCEWEAVVGELNSAHEQDKISAIQANLVERIAWQAEIDALNAAREQDRIEAIEAMKVEKLARQAEVDALNAEREQDKVTAIEASEVEKLLRQAEMDVLKAAREQDHIAAQAELVAFGAECEQNKIAAVEKCNLEMSVMLAELEDARTDCARVDQKQKNVKGEKESLIVQQNQIKNTLQTEIQVAKKEVNSLKRQLGAVTMDLKLSQAEVKQAQLSLVETQTANGMEISFMKNAMEADRAKVEKNTDYMTAKQVEVAALEVEVTTVRKEKVQLEAALAALIVECDNERERCNINHNAQEALLKNRHANSLSQIAADNLVQIRRQENVYVTKVTELEDEIKVAQSKVFASADELVAGNLAAEARLAKQTATAAVAKNALEVKMKNEMAQEMEKHEVTKKKLVETMKVERERLTKVSLDQAKEHAARSAQAIKSHEEVKRKLVEAIESDRERHTKLSADQAKEHAAKMAEEVQVHEAAKKKLIETMDGEKTRHAQFSADQATDYAAKIVQKAKQHEEARRQLVETMDGERARLNQFSADQAKEHAAEVQRYIELVGASRDTESKATKFQFEVSGKTQKIISECEHAKTVLKEELATATTEIESLKLQAATATMELKLNQAEMEAAQDQFRVELGVANGLLRAGEQDKDQDKASTELEFHNLLRKKETEFQRSLEIKDAEVKKKEAEFQSLLETKDVEVKDLMTHKDAACLELCAGIASQEKEKWKVEYVSTKEHYESQLRKLASMLDQVCKEADSVKTELATRTAQLGVARASAKAARAHTRAHVGQLVGASGLGHTDI
jgi:hypothetical protein